MSECYWQLITAYAGKVRRAEGRLSPFAEAEAGSGAGRESAEQQLGARLPDYVSG